MSTSMLAALFGARRHGARRAGGRRAGRGVPAGRGGAGVVAVAPARRQQGAAQDRDAADLEGPPAADAEDEILALIGAERVGTVEDPGEQLAQPGERLLVVDL